MTCETLWISIYLSLLYVNFNEQDNVINANIYLVFKDINSVIQAYYYADNLPQFENIPVGYKVRLIAYTVKNEKVFAYSTDLTIAKGQKLNLDLKEITEKDFKKLSNMRLSDVRSNENNREKIYSSWRYGSTMWDFKEKIIWKSKHFKMIKRCKTL